MKRLSQLEVIEIFTLENGQTVSPLRAKRLVERGLAEWDRQSGKLQPTAEARSAFRIWSGAVKVRRSK